MNTSSDGGDFEEFARARIPHLFRSAWLLCGHRVEAEDLVQETLAKVRMRRSVGSRLEKPAAYAQTTLTRTFISGRRKRSSSEVRYGDLPVGVVGDHADAYHLGAWRLGVEPRVHRQRLLLVFGVQ